MIRITIELLPGGDDKHPRHLGTAVIANDMTGDAKAGNYWAKFSQWGKPDVLWRASHVTGFDRVNRGAWDLLLIALAGALQDRRQPSAKTKRLTSGELTAVRRNATQPDLAPAESPTKAES